MEKEKKTAPMEQTEEVKEAAETKEAPKEEVLPEENPLEEELEKLKKDMAELNDRYIRTLAEYDNFRKRSQREKDAVYANATSDTVTKLLPILDSEQFDPKFHNAVMHIDNPAYGENVITDVYRKGYTLGDKVIRFSMVVVAN